MFTGSREDAKMADLFAASRLPVIFFIPSGTWPYRSGWYRSAGISRGARSNASASNS